MNRIYRLIFNPCLGVIQVASEVTARARGAAGAISTGRSGHGPRRLALAVALAMSLSNGAVFAATTVSGTPPQVGGNGMRMFGTVVGNDVVVPGGDSLNIGGPADGTYSDSISGAGSVTKVGTGTETMTGANTYTGGTFINAGTLAIGAGGSLAATGAVNLTSAGTGFDISAGGAQSIGVLSGVAGSTVSLGGNTLTLGGVGNGSFDGVIAGTGGLVKNGPGIQGLGGANTFSGGVTLNAGGLVLGNNSALGAGNLSVGGNATLDTSAPLILANAIDLAAGADLDLLGSNALTLGGVISGAGDLIKDGASTLTLTAANTYSGGTTINAGTLAIGAGGSVASSGAMNLRGTGLLDISAGGLVESGSGSIDAGLDQKGGVEVTGIGARWTVGMGNLVIGDAGTGRLRIEDGGMVESQNASVGHGVVDYDPDATGSSVEVIGSGTRWANTGELLVGESSLATMEVLYGGLVESATVSLGSNVGSEGRVRVNGFDASGVSSRLGIAENFVVGDAGTGKLLVDNGGVLDNRNGIIGNSADSTDSRALVTDTGSTWTNHGTLTVGNKGEGILEVLDGGHVESALGSIGSAEGSDGKVRVSGTRSSWEITMDPFHPDEQMIVGDAGSGLLIVEAGGTVGNGQSLIGYQDGSVGKVVVTGADSSWLTTNAVYVGIGGHGTLLIESGGTVGGGSGTIGVGAGSVGEVTVTGAGSRFMLTSPSIFPIGYAGSGALRVEAGGQVSNGLGSIGGLAGSSGQVMVTGAGSRWDNSGQLYVGHAGTGTLTIQKGGVVSNTFGWLGVEGASSSGEVTVTGAGSSWINSDNLSVGHIGTGTMLVEAGGAVRNLHGFIGDTADSTGSKVTVTGEGSAWINDGGLWVGNAGSGGLEVLDHGVVGSMEGVVGNVGDGTVLVDGTGSRWDIGDTLAVGNLGSGQVTLSNGGVVTSKYGAIGSQGQEHNTVLVQGAGSSWTGMEDLYVGLEGNAALTIADGGRVEVKAGTLDTDVVLGGYGGSTGILNIGTGGAAGVLDAATVTNGEGSATLNFNHDEADYAFTNDGTAGGTAVLIDGTTTVNQIGIGTTVLTGANMYTGATHVNAGTLLVEGSLGKTATTVADGATLGGSGSIAGAVTVADGGILAPGSSAGTLTAASLSLSSGSILDYELGRSGVVGGGVNDLVDVTGNLTLDGKLDITDIGGFGAGVYRLINYSGVLTDNGLEVGTRPTGVDANDLFVQTTFGGQVNLVSTAGLALTFWDGAIGSHHNNKAIDGGAGIWNAGNSNWTTVNGVTNGRWDDGTFAVFGGTVGMVNVVGEQRIAGLQFMSGYTLAAGTDGALSIDNAESVIRVDPTVTATIAAPIIGSGGLVKTDTGTLVLSGKNTYTGSTRIDRGTLSLDGMLAGSTRVAHGATLNGSGTLHDLDNHGTVAPGHSIGTLSLSGDYVHHDDATLLAEIEPGGSSDLLDIAGKATLDGGHVQVVKLPGQYEGGTRYTLIDAKGGVTGTFATLDQDLPFLDLLTGYDANHVYLDVQRNDVGFNIVCGDGTFNQCQVAGALDRIADAPAISDDLKATLTEVTSLTLPDAQAAFDQLSGEAHGSLASILLEGHALYGQTVSRRLAERRDETGADRLQGGSWIRIYGNSSDLDGDGNAHAADFNQRGVAFGLDAWGGDQWLVGVSLGAMNIDADFRPGDHGKADVKNASLYAAFESEHAYLDAVTSYAWWDNDVTRKIDVGSIDRTARSEYGGHRLAVHLETGWTFAMGARQRLQPLVSVEYARLGQQGFREHGAQDLDLIGSVQDVERTTTTAGLRWSAAFGQGAWTLEPTVEARWLHAFGDAYAEQAFAFTGAPDIGYRARGVSWPQDRGLLGVGLSARQGDNLDLFINVDYQKGDGLASKNISAGMRWRW